MKQTRILLMTFALILLNGCANTLPKEVVEPAPISTDIKMIEIVGGHKVWTQKVGSSDSIKLLLLHGGPGATHEYFDQYKND